MGTLDEIRARSQPLSQANLIMAQENEMIIQQNRNLLRALNLGQSSATSFVSERPASSIIVKSSIIGNSPPPGHELESYITSIRSMHNSPSSQIRILRQGVIDNFKAQQDYMDGSFGIMRKNQSS